MFTFNHHVYAVANILNNGPKSDDANLSTALIGHYLKVARSLLTKRELDKYNSLSEESYQTICLDLALFDFHDCNCVPGNTCQLLRSVKKLPTSVIAKWGQPGTALYLDGRQIPYISLSGSKYKEFSLANTNSVQYTIHNGYLWIFGTTTLKKVMYKGIFEDPLDLEYYKFCDPNGNDVECYDPDTDNFPIESHLIDPMYKMAIDIMKNAFSFPNDQANNAVSPKTAKYEE